MSSEQFSSSQECFAGDVPTERSAVGTSPAGPPAGTPGASPALAPTAVGPAPESPTGHLSAPLADTSPSPSPVPPSPTPPPEPPADQTPALPPDAQIPSLPINPTPFGAGRPPLCGRGPRSPRRLVSPQAVAVANRQLSAEQKLLILDSWQRSGLPATDFGALLGLSKQTLYAWKRRFEVLGPAGLDDQAKKKLPTGSKLPEVTKRTILMLKKANPDWGCQRISDTLCRGPGLPASPNAIARILKEAGYVTEETPTHPHPDHPRRFERAAPNQLWQTDLFTFILKRQNRRVYLVAFMDDHSRFLVGYGLHASQSAALVMEVFRAAVDSCSSPQEVLTDNGSQYVTWRGTSAFARELQKRGIRHVVAAPRHPQTLGKIERFWGTLWRECLGTAVFLDLADARQRIGHFIDYYNFQRPHQSLEGLTPADRFFGSAPQILSALKARVQANALQLAQGGLPKSPFYLTGQVGGKPFSVHTEGERMFLVAEDGARKEIDLSSPTPPVSPPASPATSPSIPPELAPMPAPVCAQGIVSAELADETEPPPGVSPLDQGLRDLQAGLPGGES